MAEWAFGTKPAEHMLHVVGHPRPRGQVPVTAKLSRRFYERLGDDIANELVDWFNAVDATYRAALRETNEANFARFDAKLEQRLAELRAEVRGELAGLKVDLLKWMFALWLTQMLAIVGFGLR